VPQERYFSSSLHYASSNQILSNSASRSLVLFITSCRNLAVWKTFGRWNDCKYLLAEVVDPLLSLKAWSIDEHNERLHDRAERANDMSDHDGKKDYHDSSVSHQICIKKYENQSWQVNGHICASAMLPLSQLCRSTAERRLRSQSNTCLKYLTARVLPIRYPIYLWLRFRCTERELCSSSLNPFFSRPENAPCHPEDLTCIAACHMCCLAWPSQECRLFCSPNCSAELAGTSTRDWHSSASCTVSKPLLVEAATILFLTQLSLRMGRHQGPTPGSLHHCSGPQGRDIQCPGLQYSGYTCGKVIRTIGWSDGERKRQRDW